MPYPSARKTPRPYTIGHPPNKKATIAQFRIWSPSRQRSWLTTMNTEKAKNALNPDQLTLLTQAQLIFDRGI